MKEVTDKELRLQTESLLRRVAAGESLVVTIDGRHVADLIPYRSEVERWMHRDELIELMNSFSRSGATSEN
jgi:prevent-host-death family protein